MAASVVFLHTDLLTVVLNHLCCYHYSFVPNLGVSGVLGKGEDGSNKIITISQNGRGGVLFLCHSLIIIK